MKVNLYVVVRDMAQATRFYTEVFQQQPAVVTPAYTGFNVNGTLYGLFDARYMPPISSGGNVVPNILVEDIDEEYERLKTLLPTFQSEIRENGPYRLFLLADPDGNMIEFYAERAVA